MEVVVIGAGFGGLGAALALAEAGATVTIHEALAYPGGCASTFTRKGYRFEAGATLFSGLGPEQLFGRWIRRWDLDVAVEWLDPVVEVRAPELRLAVSRSREAFLDALCALPDAPAPALRRFFADQRAIADTLWALFDDPALLPPLSPNALLRHVARSPRYLRLLPVVHRSLATVLAGYGLAEWAPLRAWLGGLCQITVQCPPAEAEAPFALAAMDYFWRGTGHVRGEIGRLAEGLAAAVERAGGTVRFADRVVGLRRDGEGWIVRSRSGERRADRVVADLLPADVAALVGGNPALVARHAPVAAGWGAVMVYRVVRGVDGPAHHLDLTADPDAPLTDGNHVFVSVAGPEDARGGPADHRVLTASTHVALADLRADDPGARVAGIQAAMRRTIARLAPELEDVVLEMTASPRTFQRFVRRREGAVGGIPRRVGWGAYALGPVEAERGLWLVGDSVFPGQSTYATAVGGVRVAEAIARGR